MGGQRIGERFTAFDLRQHIIDDDSQRALGQELPRDAQAAIQRRASADQRGEFLGKITECPYA